jgi:hypothetical protein
MKAQIIRKTMSIMSLFLMMFLTVAISRDANACHHCSKALVPVAICSAGGTNIPLPYFVCCQLLDTKGHSVWGNTWVGTSCKNADRRAIYDSGCKKSSPVYGAGASIIGNCQYSYSMGKHSKGC